MKASVPEERKEPWVRAAQSLACQLPSSQRKQLFHAFWERNLALQGGKGPGSQSQKAGAEGNRHTRASQQISEAGARPG